MYAEQLCAGIFEQFMGLGTEKEKGCRIGHHATQAGGIDYWKLILKNLKIRALFGYLMGLRF